MLTNWIGGVTGGRFAPGVLGGFQDIGEMGTIWQQAGRLGTTQQQGEEMSPRPVDSIRILPESLEILERLYVCCLPALGTLHYVELNGLTFLQALEAIRVDGGVMHEDIFAVLTRDKAKALRVIKPLHCTLFHFESYFLNFELRLSETERPLAESLLGWASTAHARLFLRYVHLTTNLENGYEIRQTDHSIPLLGIWDSFWSRAEV